MEEKKKRGYRLAGPAGKEEERRWSVPPGLSHEEI
jgi:hypothetical protein